MLSSALSQVLERARTRFGLEVEILDGELRNVYPDGGGDFGRLMREEPELGRGLRDTLVLGQTRDFDAGSRRFRLFPLRSDRLGARGGLLAISGGNAGHAGEFAPWAEFAKAAIESDLSAADVLREERQSSRRLLAILRFLRYLLESADERDVAQALVQAAAVWFDVDARIYRRDLHGDFILQNWLPGVDPDDASRRLEAQTVGGDREVRRLASSADLGALSQSTGEVMLVPLAGSSRAEWTMTLAGAIPQEAESVFPVVARIVGVQLEALHARRLEEVRRRFETIIRQSGLAAERLALQLVGELVRETGAAGATLTLVKDGESRRIVSFGPEAGDAVPAHDDTWITRAERVVFALAVAPNQRAVLDLRADHAKPFGREDADVAAAFARVLQTWLVGAVSSFTDSADLLETRAASAPPGFEKRIEEELERAKRFDLHLSLVLVDVAAPSTAVAQIVDALRRELRGSDLLGTTSGRQVAALLTHTDDRGLDNVVARLRRRLADAADRLNIAEVRLGQAAFSPDCRTAAALLSRAVREAEPIVVH